MGLALIVHGGAGDIPLERYAAARAGCQAAAVVGWRVLVAGGSALDAVQAAIMALEDNPSYNAGTGAVLTEDGHAQLDAGLMDGAALDVGAVTGVERVKNPIALARAVLASPHVLLAGPGAELFAQRAGIALCAPEALVTPAQRARWRRGYQAGDDVNVESAPERLVAVTDTHEPPPASRNGALPGAPADLVHLDGDQHGTVGAVAVDAHGHVAAGASTGGIAAKHPGRVGDTPLVGAGFYADDELGGVSSTGHGEDFIRLLLAHRAAASLATGHSAQAAASAAIRLLGERAGGHGGLILLDRAGRVGYARNTPAMAHAFIVEGMGTPFDGV
ncbi:MAG: isoaspartyl peptidase/L-asparaginase [Ktedonobacterales bacterium]|nr:isoaspartyl peptidase/L-asparaginase [Ktedonobacterales bacterium]